MKKEKWRIDSKGLSSTLLISLILLITVFSISMQITPARAQGTVVRVIPATTEFGSGSAIGEEFKVAVVIENVTDLYGVDLKIGWDTTYLEYIDHTLTIPWNNSQTPVDPSPYAGLLYAPILPILDANDTAGGTYQAAVSTLGGHPFNGNGTAFNMTFKVIGEPEPWEEDVNTTIRFLLHDVADTSGTSIPHDVVNATVIILSPAFQYPDIPLLKVMHEGNEEITGIRECNNFTVDVYLMGDGGTDLDAFWDVAGIEILLNFNTTLLEALAVTIDPDSWFASFWPNTLVTANEINNTAGTVEIAFAGYGLNHTAPTGQGRLFNITFHSIYESDTAPLPSESIYLKNQIAYTGSYIFNSIGGLVDGTDPVGTFWHEISRSFGGGPYEILSWEDNGDSGLNTGDQIILNDTTTGFYFDHHLDHISGILNLTQQPFAALDDNVWAASFGPDNLDNNGLPGRYIGTDDPYNGFGVPNWTGNFSLTYPFVSVDSITVTALPFTADNYTYTLTEGVDYIVHADDDLIELLTPVDVDIVNEHWVDGVNNTLNGWPGINYVASGISSVYVDMMNGTARFGVNNGYAMAPPAEWWYDPDWALELEGWWALGYFPGSWNWPAGSEWWINYTAASYLTVDYDAEPEITPRFVEFDGDYSDFLTLSDPIGSNWNETYPRDWRAFTVTNWTDGDSSGNVTSSDYIDVISAEGNRTYLVNDVATIIRTSRKPWIVEDDPDDLFFGTKPIVDLAGFPHPERALSPWNNKPYAVPLPHKVENASYTASGPPVADFAFSPAEPREDENVVFNASTSIDPDGYIVSYTWNYGDGSPVEVTDQDTVTHSFNRGTYNVTLMVTDNSSLTDTYWQLVAILPPLALSVTPDSGFASTTITGSGFDADSAITITWDGTPIPTVPHPLTSDSNGNFTAIISVLVQNDPGIHNVTATDEGGNTAQATFTVMDMTGPAGIDGATGEQGPAGIDGATGEQGPAGPVELLWAATILAIAAICLAAYTLFGKR